MLDTSVVLSRSTYALTWTSENIGDQPEALFVLPDTADPQRRAQATVRASEELTQLGLFDRQRGVHPALVSTFRLLARPEVEFYGYLAHQQRREPFTALAVAGGGWGLLAILDDTTLALHPVRGDSVAEALIGQLPPVPAAHGQSLTVPATAVDGPVGRQAEEEFSVFAGQGRTDPAVTRLKRLADEPRTGGAELHVAVRDRNGRRRRNAFPLKVIDVESGRWFIQRQHNASREVWITAAPATSQTLATKLYEMGRALASSR
ncbi:ESX secretion-associated protein EspG [Kutzneria sp. NPDC052558]|uniref:ESX secretion-associated protein EspG n=1 Tax=Kutzneria sp. NPDC052558 TaxID=3364121 RepID=UPI0037C9187E